jgi:hypothetical protein
LLTDAHGGGVEAAAEESDPFAGQVEQVADVGAAVGIVEQRALDVAQDVG